MRSTVGFITASGNISIVPSHENDLYSSKPEQDCCQHYSTRKDFDVNTHAEVAPKISTLLAMVVVAKQNANSPVNATAIANRSRVFDTKYRMRMLVMGIRDARTVTNTLMAECKGAAAYCAISDDGSEAIGF